MFKLRSLVVSVAILTAATSAALAENRIALVIGNSAYRNVTALPNPANDAKAVSELLAGAGFEITPAENLTQTDMRRVVRDFAAKVAEKGSDTVALVFYAGHGVQVDGENFLVPVDANIARESDLPIEAVRLADLMNVLAAVPAKARIVILDACRNNPFSDIAKTTGRGLAIVDAPKGSIVSYSTAPGSVAADGSGNHSPFTAALLKVARAPGLPIEQAFKQVRFEVNQTTDGQQTPWESSSLVSNFAFFPGQGGASKADEASPRGVAAWKERLGKMPTERAYELVIREDVPEGYEAFVAVYQAPPFAPRIRAIYDRRVEMIAWYTATTINTVLSFEAFLSRFANSDLAPTARRLLERAKNRSLTPAAQAGAQTGANAAQPVNLTGPGVPGVRVVERVVEKIVPQVQIVEKVVEKIVRVPVACEQEYPRPRIRPVPQPYYPRYRPRVYNPQPRIHIVPRYVPRYNPNYRRRGHPR